MEESLEENILNCLWDAGCPLHLLDIWDQLDKRGLAIPIKSLEKVLYAMHRLGLLIEYDNQIDYPTYNPNISRLDFYRSSIRVIQLCSKNKRVDSVL